MNHLLFILLPYFLQLFAVCVRHSRSACAHGVELRQFRSGRRGLLFDSKSQSFRPYQQQAGGLLPTSRPTKAAFDFDYEKM